MFFQINVTPKEKKASERNEKKEENTKVQTLTLAPFQPPTHIKLESKINTTVQTTLIVKNAGNRVLRVTVSKSPPPERCFNLNGSEWTIEPDDTINLEIMWEPKEFGIWRDTLQLSDSRRIKHDVFLILSCPQPKLPKTKGIRKIQTDSSKVSNSNLSKNSLMHKQSILKKRSTFSKIETQSKTIQQKRLRPLENEFGNKENISSNIEQHLSNEHQAPKKMRSDTSSHDFSALLNSRSFMLTPITTKSKSNDFDKLDDKIFTSPKFDFTSREFLQESSQTKLRKETYITVPKFISHSPDITNENIIQQFNNSLTSESDNILRKKENQQSELSMLIDDIKFTPLKILKEKNDFEFLPACCSTEKKSHHSNHLTDSSAQNPIARNITFEMSSPESSLNLKLESTHDSEVYQSQESLHLQYSSSINILEKNEQSKHNFKSPCKKTDNHSGSSTYKIDRTKRFISDSNNYQTIDSVKNILEADMWSNGHGHNDSIHLHLNSSLSSIDEENYLDDYNHLVRNKGDTKSVCIEISPPKKFLEKKAPLRKVSPKYKTGKIIKEKSIVEATNLKKKLQLDYSAKEMMPAPSIKISKLSLAKLRKPFKKINNSYNTENRDQSDSLFLFYNPDPFAASTTVDPFLANNLFCDEKWMFNQELEFKKWLNALLTPPEDLTTDIESCMIDIAKIWQSCRNKEDVTLAETKESVSSRYHTNLKLDMLRKAAVAMYQKKEIITPLSQVTMAVEKEMLLVRPDRDLHRDIGLQKILLELLLSYNPLWLRIGLETIYGEKIPLRSNDDLTGLTRFLLHRFFSDPYLVKSYSYPNHPNVRLPNFQPFMNKFVLKKFVYLVYFLDHAKNNKLIGHDPCLFHKKALIKDSRSILLTFSREVLSGIGDVTKVLRNYGYTVSHKQTYLDEFDFAVKEISIDLRDGVRLCRIMELITGKRCLTCRCRVPAISRLQRVHNVNIALTSLTESGYTITGNIDAKSIADGHKEKTLSLLWQIIYKVQAPRFEKAAKVIQKWWRAKFWYVKIKLFNRNRKNVAATTIQKSWRCYLARKALSRLKEEFEEHMAIQIEAAKTLQYYWRLRTQMKYIQREFQETRLNVIRIQRWWKRIHATKMYVHEFKTKRKLIINVQQKWRAKKIMEIERNNFLILKESAKLLQSHWRAKKEGQKCLQDYQELKNNVILMQRRWRAKKKMREEICIYAGTLTAIRLIQNWWRRCSLLKSDRNNFLELKDAVKVVEKHWIRKITILDERKEFLSIKESASVIQRAWKNYKTCRHFVVELKQQKLMCLKIQSWWRMVIVKKEYKKYRNSCILIQKWWRNIILSRLIRTQYLSNKQSAIVLQKNWRMKMAQKTFSRTTNSIILIQKWYRNVKFSRQVRAKYLTQKNSIKLIENWWLSLKARNACRSKYLKLKSTSTFIQKRWRNKILMRNLRENYLTVRASVITIQSWWRMIQEKQRFIQFRRETKAAVNLQRRWRALLEGRRVRKQYVLKRNAVIFVQRKWRATLLAKVEGNRFQKQKQAALIIQKNWRSHVKVREYRRKKLAINTIKQWMKHKLEGKQIRSNYSILRTNVIRLQQYWRTKQLKKSFVEKKEAAIVIQKQWRCYVAVRDYKKKKLAVQFIQNRRRNMLRAREIRHHYIQFRTMVIKIQRLWRTKVEQRKFQQIRVAAIKIQKFWKSWILTKQLHAEFSRKLLAVVTIQRQFRAWRKGVGVRKNYKYILDKVRTIQLRWRRILLVRRLAILQQKRKSAVIIIENWWVRIRKIREEINLQNQAATTIQTAWRGYIVRRAACKQITDLRKRAEKAAETAVPTATLAYRLKETIELFIQASNIGQISLCLSSLDIITRLSPNACINVCRLNLVSRLYEILTLANQSMPWLEICLKDVSILLSLAKFQKTSEFVRQKENIETLSRILKISIDKKNELFLSAATLMWILIEDEEYAEAVKNCSKSKYMLVSLHSSIFKKYNKLPTKSELLPSPKPDWGLSNKRPRTFPSILLAINNLVKKLNFVPSANLVRPLNNTLR